MAATRCLTPLANLLVLLALSVCLVFLAQDVVISQSGPAASGGLYRLQRGRRRALQESGEQAGGQGEEGSDSQSAGGARTAETALHSAGAAEGVPEGGSAGGAGAAAAGGDVRESAGEGSEGVLPEGGSAGEPSDAGAETALETAGAASAAAAAGATTRAEGTEEGQPGTASTQGAAAVPTDDTQPLLSPFSVTEAVEEAAAHPSFPLPDVDHPPKTIAEAVAGLQSAPQGDVDPGQTVILTTVTTGYLDFAWNWLAALDRLGLGQRALLVAEDDKAYEALSAARPLQTVRQTHVLPHEDASQGGGGQAGATHGVFDSDFFRNVMCRRPATILQVLRQNVSVLFSDLDIAWLRNPFPHFTGGFDVWMQEDTNDASEAGQRFPEGKPMLWKGNVKGLMCPGFMLVRNTERAMNLIKLWEEFIMDKIRTTRKPQNDQEALNHVLHTRPDVALGVLPVNRFPNGCIFLEDSICGSEQHQRYTEAFQNWNSTASIVHVNWMVGHHLKMQQMQKNSMWFLHRTKHHSEAQY